MSVVWALSRDARGRRLGSLLGLAAVIAVVTAAVLATAAGAHRTVGVLDTYLEETDARDIGAYVLSGDFVAGTDRARSLRDAVASVDGVTAVTSTYGTFLVPHGDVDLDADFILTSSPDGRFETMDRPSILRGRMPSDDAVDEVALNETAADGLGLDIGDSLSSGTLTPETVAGLYAGTAGMTGADGPELDLEVVGVVRTGEDLSEMTHVAGGVGITSPAFAEAYDGRIGRTVFLLSIAAEPGTDVDAVQQVLDEHVGDRGDAFASSIEDDFVGEVSNGHRSLAAGIAVFSLVAALAGLLAIGQAISRQNMLRAPADQIARGLGATRLERVLAICLPAGLAIGAGVAAGALGAMALSPLFPLSVARHAELSPGFRIDPVVLGAGAALITAACLAWTLLSARRIVSRTATPLPARAHRSRRSLLASRASGWGLPASLVVGLRTVAEPGRGTTAVPARSAILGAAVAVSGVVAIATFVTSVHAAESEPARYGWPWSASPEVIDQNPAKAAAETADDPDLVATGVLNGAPLQVGSETAFSYAVDVHRGSIEFTLLDGRLPTGRHEIALGRRTLDALGLTIGSSVEVTSPSGVGDELTIVGVVVPPLVDGTDPGKGAVLTLDGLDAIRPEATSGYLVLTYADGVDRPALEARLADEYGLTFSATDGLAPGQVQQLEGMRDVLAALTAFLALVGTIGLIHFLAVSVRRRRGQYAILRALGFVGAQVRRSVAWQAAFATGIGVVIGLPAGVIIGRSAWLLAVREVAMVDDPATPWIAMAAVVAVALVGAAALSVGPGWYAAKGRPAANLRAE